MRELKFRAWDAEKWRYTNDLRRIGKLFNVDLDGRITLVDFTKEIQTIIVEQYTGLKDKNGKEIYEGDIVTIEPYAKPFKVVFDKQYASFAGDNRTAGRLFNSLYSSDYEVVGNIHENPELLGAKS